MGHGALEGSGGCAVTDGPPPRAHSGSECGRDPSALSEDVLPFPTYEADFPRARQAKQHVTTDWIQKRMEELSCLPLRQTFKKFLGKGYHSFDSLCYCSENASYFS